MTNDEKKSIARPPIVVVMGHIDHGKTKILDWIRNTKVVESESGGITQHIGAYQINFCPKEILRPAGSGTQNDLAKECRQITFIDTPGHEAFSKMRSRGAKVADVAVLVVAGDEGIKNQTKEALKTIQENELPLVVAINKSDKAEFNAEKVKQELATENLLVESYGGQIPCVEISAKTGQNMESLLEIILLLADVEELKGNPEKPAEGVTIETHLDPLRGVSATLLILDGSLHKGDFVVMGRSLESVKILEDFLGRAMESAGLSSPIRLAGLINMPAVGDKFQTFATRAEAKKFIAALPPEDKKSVAPPIIAGEDKNKLIFNVILKADVTGSIEALEEEFNKLNTDEFGINILKSGAGNINESDVKLALATKIVTIVGFKVKIEPVVKELAGKSNIHIVTSEVIYDLLNSIKEELTDLLPPLVSRTEIGRVKILKCFKRDGIKQIVGGRVEDGRIEKGALVEIKRGVEKIGPGKISQLQKDKISANEVQKSFEFGVLIESDKEIKEGDSLTVFYEEISKRKIS